LNIRDIFLENQRVNKKKYLTLKFIIERKKNESGVFISIKDGA